MKYAKIGEQLRLVREKKGLSYEQIFEITRIQPEILKAIEAGEAPVADVILNGFIRSYAQALGFEVEKFFTKEKEESDKQESRPSSKQNPPQNRNYNLKKYFVFFAGFAFLVLSLFLIGLFKEEEKEPTPSVDQELSAESKIPSVSETEKQENKPLPFKEGSLFDQIKDSAFKKEILIQSSEKLKIYFKTDRGGTITKNLSPSVWFQIKAQNSIYLRFDEHIGGVTLFYNGRQIFVDQNVFFERSF